MRYLIAVLLAGLCVPASGQLRLVSTDRLPLPVGRVWSAPHFSPDGTSIFLTTAGYRGIWQFTPATQSLRQICDDAGAGFGFTVSPDGGKVAYRRTLEGLPAHRRVQEAVALDLRSGEQVVMVSGNDIPAPVYAGGQVLCSTTADLKNTLPVSGATTAVLGVEETKIAAVVNGVPVRLDPFQGGSYIWPSLSPDGTRLVAYEMSRGTFVADLHGTVLAQFGRRDAPVWTRSGRWLVYMNEKDDGHQITGSDIFCVSPDGKTTIRLTDTPAIELLPACSPVDDRILVCTPAGEVLVLRYEEEGR
jgi:Tol biopolymer transport system component